MLCLLLVEGVKNVFKKITYFYLPSILGGFLVAISVFFPWKERFLLNGEVAVQNGLGWVTTNVVMPRINNDYYLRIPDFTIVAGILLLLCITLLHFKQLISAILVYAMCILSLYVDGFLEKGGYAYIEFLLALGLLIAVTGLISTFNEQLYSALAILFTNVFTGSFIFIAIERSSNDYRPWYDSNGILLVKYSSSSGEKTIFLLAGLLLLLLGAVLPFVSKLFRTSLFKKKELTAETK
jgi:hypothetical protein